MSKFYDFEAEDVMCNMHKMEKYQEQGFGILDFPCNQFGNQAPGTNEEIVSFCDAKFGITFKHYAKIDVNGTDAHPLYQFLKEQKGFAGFDQDNPLTPMLESMLTRTRPDYMESADKHPE